MLSRHVVYLPVPSLIIRREEVLNRAKTFHSTPSYRSLYKSCLKRPCVFKYPDMITMTIINYCLLNLYKMYTYQTVAPSRLMKLLQNDLRTLVTVIYILKWLFFLLSYYFCSVSSLYKFYFSNCRHWNFSKLCIVL